MKTSNLAARTIRHSESGLVWEEKISGAQGSIEVQRYATFRVRATGATTVTIDGILAMTMVSGEIAIFNAGNGIADPNIAPFPGTTTDAKQTVTIAIGGANAFVQVAREIDRQA